MFLDQIKIQIKAFILPTILFLIVFHFSLKGPFAI